MENKKNKVIIIILVSIIVILVGVLSYLFIIDPSIQNSRSKYINYGVEYAVFQIMNQTSQCVLVPLTYGNYTINVVAYECLNMTK